MLNGKKRCFKSIPITRMTVDANAIISPIVVLEKLPRKIEEFLFIQKNIIKSNATENESRQKSKKNNRKFKKYKKRFTRLKKRFKEARINSDTSNDSEKQLEKYNTNVAVVNKLKSIQSVNKNKVQFNSSFSNKFPKVILERLSPKKEKNLFTDNKYSFHNKTEDRCNSNDANLQGSTNKKADFKQIPEPERNNFISALNESKQICNEIKNEVEDTDYLDYGINYCDMESFDKNEKTEVYNEMECFLDKEYNDGAENIVNKEDTHNDIKIELVTSLNENNKKHNKVTSEVYGDKEDDNNVVIGDFDNKEDIDILVTENCINIENVSDDILIEEDKNDLLYTPVTPTKILDNSRDVYDVAINHENCYTEEVEHSKNKIVTLQDVYKIGYDKSTGGLVNKWLIDESSSSSLKSNSTSCLITTIEVAGTNESDLRLFVVKCLKCNIVQPRNRTRIIVNCKICDSIMYHECLICQNKYQSIYTMYSHLSRKHKVEKSIVNKFKKHQTASVVKESDNEIDYLRLVQYHDERDAEILRTVPDPITAYCLDCHKQVSATDKSENWCSICKTKYIFICNTCKYIRKNYGQMRLHVLRSHAKKILTCPNNCGKSFSYSRTHYDHVKFCQRSLNVSNNKSKLIKGSSVKVNKSYCYKCGQYFENRQSMQEHVNDCGNLNPLSCDYCDFKTESKSMLENHRQTKHMLLLF